MYFLCTHIIQVSIYSIFIGGKEGMYWYVPSSAPTFYKFNDILESSKGNKLDEKVSIFCNTSSLEKARLFMFGVWRRHIFETQPTSISRAPKKALLRDTRISPSWGKMYKSIFLGFGAQHNTHNL
jgi:hypothetical protein